jgi:hypothetical protein
MQLRTMGAAAALFLLMAGAADAAVMRFTTGLKGGDEVPPNATTGSGQVMAELDTDTKRFSYVVTYSGLTGPAVAAHFHGPAAPGANAPPMVMVMDLASPMSATATLTDGQIADLEAGKWYFNIHTAAHPGGEIRGQLRPTP